MEYICKWSDEVRSNAMIKIQPEDNVWRWFYRVEGPRFRYDQGNHFGKIATVKRFLRQEFYPHPKARFRLVRPNNAVAGVCN